MDKKTESFRRRRLPPALSWMVLVFLTAAGLTPQHSPRSVPRVNVQGRIVQFSFAPDGRRDGVILEDRTWVRLSPHTSLMPGALQIGDPVSVSGTRVAEVPNRVVERVILRKGGRVILNDTGSFTPKFEEGSGEVARASALSSSGRILSVGLDRRSRIARLMLENGTTVRIPGNATLDAGSVPIGRSIRVNGVGSGSQEGQSILAMSLKAEDESELLKGVHLGKPLAWTIKSGKVGQLLINLQGEADGVLLTDGSAVRFGPVPVSRVLSLKAGTNIEAAGLQNGTTVQSEIILVPEENWVLDRSDLLPFQQAGVTDSSKPHPGRLFIDESSKIEAVVTDLNGDVDTLVLRNGVIAKVPPRLRGLVNQKLKKGDIVSVTGRGKNYSQGTAIELETIHSSH